MNEDVAPDRWLTIQEARAIVHVSRRTIYHWLAQGKLVTQRTAGGAVRIKESSLWGGTTSSGGNRAAGSSARSQSEPSAPSSPAPSTPNA